MMRQISTALSTLTLLSLFALITGLLAARPAAAAPQILAALPNPAGIQFSCENGVCLARLSTYCLQQRRPIPDGREVYRAATPADFAIVYTATDGTEKSIPATDHVMFTESRGFMSIAARTTERTLKELGATEARLVVSAHAVLVPEPTEGDANPISPREVAYATQSLRGLGADIVDVSPNAKAATLLAALSKRVGFASVVPPADAEALWSKTVQQELAATPATTATITPIARERLDSCMLYTENFRYHGFKRCIDSQHDELLRDLNQRYWRSQAGS